MYCEIRMQSSQAYLVRCNIYGSEHYSYFDGEKVLIDFPSLAPGLKRYVDKLSMDDFLSQYKVLEEAPEAKQIFEVVEKQKVRVVTKEEWLKIKEQKEYDDFQDNSRDEDGHHYYKDMW